MSYIHQDLAMFISAIVAFTLFLRLKSLIKGTISGMNWFLTGIVIFLISTFIDYIEDTPLSILLPDATNEAKWDFIVMVLGYTPGAICICIGLTAWLKTARILQKEIEQREVHEQELKLALQQARDANDTKNKFLSIVSHELRTPLNAIIGFSQIMGDEKHINLSDAKYREYSNIILSSGRHLLDTINHVLNLAAHEEGKYDINEEAFCVEEEIRDCLYLMEMEARKAKVSLEKPLDIDTYIKADKRLVKQILINLLSNAIKFSNAGGTVVCTVDTTDTSEVVLCIKDTGVGMTPAEVEQAIQPFSTLGAPISRKKLGVGIGLALTKRFTELHGGTLKINSTKNKGTDVMVIFPASRSV